MKVTPILTEKSLNLAKDGKYTFVVDVGLNKLEIIKLINSIYGVHVKTVRTLNYKSGEKRNVRGRKVSIKAFKKAIATLTKDEKIDAFEVKKEKISLGEIRWNLYACKLFYIFFYFTRRAHKIPPC